MPPWPYGDRAATSQLLRLAQFEREGPGASRTAFHFVGVGPQLLVAREARLVIALDSWITSRATTWQRELVERLLDAEIEQDSV